MSIHFKSHVGREGGEAMLTEESPLEADMPDHEGTDGNGKVRL